jgi:hypothetical protein
MSPKRSPAADRPGDKRDRPAVWTSTHACGRFRKSAPAPVGANCDESCETGGCAANGVASWRLVQARRVERATARAQNAHRRSPQPVIATTESGSRRCRETSPKALAASNRARETHLGQTRPETLSADPRRGRTTSVAWLPPSAIAEQKVQSRGTSRNRRFPRQLPPVQPRAAGERFSMGPGKPEAAASSRVRVNQG